MLLGIGFAAGVITAISPCVLPVLPIILAGGATGGGRRPFAIIAGLVCSFTLFTLTASVILSAIGLPQDFLRNVAIGLLLLLAITLVVPRVGLILERPFAFLTRRRGGNLGGGFLLGASLGLVFVPCAGPVLATVTVLAAQHRVGAETVLLTLAYALGASVPMLLIALGGHRVAKRLRSQSDNVRRLMGVLVAASAVAIIFNVEQSVQTALGGYTTSLQNQIENTSLAGKKLASLRGTKNRFADLKKTTRGAKLPVLGRAPEFVGISHWLNTPGERPVRLASLRGKVVLVDFWTYSCINCIRTIPHLRAWYATYGRYGFEIVGVHTPEFAFEHELSNVRQATYDLHVGWPVALDNGYKTWTAYSNEYWPADYLIDSRGRVRATHFGEGDYTQSESEIRSLLTERGAFVSQQKAAVADQTPTEVVTPETYLGYVRLERYAGSAIRQDTTAGYSLPAALPQNDLAYGGVWKIGGERILAVRDARLRLHFHARDVYIVLGGHGHIDSLVNGKRLGSLTVNQDRLYTLVSGSAVRDGILELRFSPGVNAYSFTFG